MTIYHEQEPIYGVPSAEFIDQLMSVAPGDPLTPQIEAGLFAVIEIAAAEDEITVAEWRYKLSAIEANDPETVNEIIDLKEIRERRRKALADHIAKLEAEIAN